jgi:dTDP-4-amino-4,6-dideoxygalactose transaminase
MAGPGLSVFGQEEEAEVLDVLRSRELSRYRFDDDGTAPPSKVRSFETEFAALTGSPFCLATNSCTSALLAGLLAAGIGPGDEVIVPAYTFIAPIAAVAHAGATPVLAEIDESLLLDPVDLAARITPRTKAILAVHMLGAPCDLDALASVAGRHGVALIEDCAQAGGGSFRGRYLGTFGRFGAFSLNVFKTFTAGDGGVLLTADRDLFELAFAIHDHGAAPLRQGVTEGPPVFGLNLRMHELAGALALAQVRKLPQILRTLRQNKARLGAAVGKLPGVSERPVHDPDGECATVLCYLFDSAAHAARAAEGLGTITLDRSGKHNYANMPQLRQGDGTNPGLPRTDDILRRAVALSVGVTDSYLGTATGIGLSSSAADIERMARQFRAVVIEAYREAR